MDLFRLTQDRQEGPTSHLEVLGKEEEAHRAGRDTKVAEVRHGIQETRGEAGDQAPLQEEEKEVGDRRQTQNVGSHRRRLTRGPKDPPASKVGCGSSRRGPG